MVISIISIIISVIAVGISIVSIIESKNQNKKNTQKEELIKSIENDLINGFNILIENKELKDKRIQYLLSFNYLVKKLERRYIEGDHRESLNLLQDKIVDCLINESSDIEMDLDFYVYDVIKSIYK